MKIKKLYAVFYMILSIIGLICLLLISLETMAKEKLVVKKTVQVKSIPCTSNKNIVRVSTKRLTALSFLEPPKEVVPGGSSFDFKRVQNDVFIKALSLSSRTNVFVFVGKRRCRFDLIAAEFDTDDLLEVREPNENLMEVQFK